MRRIALAFLVAFVGLAVAGPAASAYKGKVAGGTLTLTGDKRGGKVTLQLKKGAPGTLVVDVGSNGSADLTFARKRFTRVTVNAGAGNDIVTVSDRNGVFTNQELTRVNGGTGTDKLTGGKGPEIFTGGTGKDTIAGAGGDDFFVWNPGDGADKADGAAGFDALDSAGGPGNDTFSVDPSGFRVHVSINGVVINLGGTEFVSMFGAGGNDAITSGLVPGVTIAGDGGLGNDTVTGGTEADFLFGGPGNDAIDGNGGDDIVLLEEGDDSFVWNHGDGNDFVDGGDGAGDSFAFSGSTAVETIVAGPNVDGDGLRVTRTVDDVIVDAYGIESLALNPLEGTDSVTVGNLTGTGVTSVGVDLGVAAAGDAASDTVTVQGTAGNDTISAVAVGPLVQVTGLTAQVDVSNAESVSDLLRIEGGGGNDTLTGGSLSTIVEPRARRRRRQRRPDRWQRRRPSQWRRRLRRSRRERGGRHDAPRRGQRHGDVGSRRRQRHRRGRGRRRHAGLQRRRRRRGVRHVRRRRAASAHPQPRRDRDGHGRSRGRLAERRRRRRHDHRQRPGRRPTPRRCPSTSGPPTSRRTPSVLNGTAGVDLVGIAGGFGSVAVGTTSLQIALANSDPLIDELTVNTLAGPDQIGAASLAVTSIHVTLNGGNDADIIAGSPGNDALNGEAGADVIQAGDGSDVINGGADTDYCDGGSGIDTGSNCETAVNIEILSQAP